MAAAAQNLCPVTLELGGKAPAIVCDDFPLATAAERILFVKCLNAGQICTTVDHVFVPRAQVEPSPSWPRRSCPSATRASTRRTTRRSSTSARSTAWWARSTMRARAARR